MDIIIKAMPKYKNYKDSGVEWLGEVPEGWEIRRLKSISIVKRGASPRPIDDPKYFNDNGKYSWVRISDVSASNHYLNKTKEKLSKLGSSLSVKLRPGELFLSIAGTVGKPIISNIFCCIHDGFVYFPTLCGDPEYLFRVFESGQPYSGLGKHGTQLNLNTDTVGNIYVPYPSKFERTTIANFLDKKTIQIDQAIAIKEKQISLLKEHKQILIQNAVTRGLNPNVAMRDSGVEWIGEIPKHWEVKKIKFLSTIFRGKFTHRPRNDPSFYDGNYPFFQTGDVAKSSKFLYKYKQTLNEKGLKVSTLIPKGTVVMTIAANIGDVAILDLDACFPDSVVGFKVNSNIKRDFLYYSLKAMKKQFMDSAIKNTQMNLNVERIGINSICEPCLNEQNIIVQYIEVQTTKINQAITLQNQQIKKLQEYKATLINSAVTGKIKVKALL